MNSIRQIQELNKRELENGVSTEASWHADYRDTAYIYIGGLPFELSEGDVITIFSQFGEPTYINLIRDKETGKSRGFAFLKYEDQRSTDLAVDNLGGTVIMGRTLKVDHTRYKKKDDEPDEGISLEDQNQVEDGDSRRKRRRNSESESEEERPMLQEEKDLAALIRDHDEDDPMKAFLIEEKREEVALALARVKDEKHPRKDRKHKHRHHKSRRPREEEDETHNGRRARHHRDERHTRSRSREDNALVRENENRSRHSRPNGEERSKGHSPRRRTSRRDSSDRGRNRDDFGDDGEPRRSRDKSREERYHYSRRDS